MSPHPRQETKPTYHEHQLEWINTSSETPPIGFFPHELGLTPDPLAAATPIADGEQNATLEVGSSATAPHGSVAGVGARTPRPGDQTTANWVGPH